MKGTGPLKVLQMGMPSFTTAPTHPALPPFYHHQAREFEGNPLELSYFLLSQLPVDDDMRQQLLEAKTGVWGMMGV